MISIMEQTQAEPRVLQCMEVWGGNQAVSTALELPGLDAWLFSEPAGGVEGGGGDVHYVSSCAAGALSRLLLADVCGHGVEAAEAARRLRKLMGRHINQHQQTRFVRSMNREFAELARDGRFATAIAFTYDAPQNRLQVCNAGHPPPLVFSARYRAWSSLEPAAGSLKTSANLPLGIDQTVEYEEFDAAIEVGDFVLCYTDGLIECRDRQGAMLERQGVLKLLARLDPGNPQKLVQGLVSALQETGAQIADDLTLLLFRPNGARRRVPLHDRLLAPFRVVRALASARGS
jgi:serine phosphatase RsbU (regulator of sigma subunit)